MSMSTYKSLGGPPGGLLLANDAELAQRIEAIAYPGLTANFDAGKTAALVADDARLDGRRSGVRHRDDRHCASAGRPARRRWVCRSFRSTEGVTGSHQFAHRGRRASAAVRPQQPGCAERTCSTCGIGLPIAAGPGDLNGLRLGTPEVARAGHDGRRHARARLVHHPRPDRQRPRTSPDDVAAWRTQFDQVYFTTDNPTVPPHRSRRASVRRSWVSASW